MGLDLILGGMILIAAIRGWMRGFVLQAIRLTGLVSCVYLAEPVRDLARPYVAPHLASIRVDLLDRLLWWASAVLSYVVMVGLGSLTIKMYRRRTFGEAEPSRADQFAGFLLGAAKGGVVVAFLVAALNRYAVDWAKQVDWAEEQAKTSQALVWNQQYQPAARIWQSQPVQNLVTRVQTQGLKPPGPAKPKSAEPDSEPTEATASVEKVAPKLELPAKASDEEKLRAEIEDLRRRFQGLDKPESH